MDNPSGERTTRLIAVAMLGFYALVAQTLLFRDFFSVFEGNELGISAFFTSWLLWVAVGAFVVRAGSGLTRRFPLLALLYIPAFLLQRYLVLNARAFAGVEAYEVFPFMPTFGMAFLANAPISFLTGFLFTLACRWTSEVADLPVSRVYIAETFGSCLGGLFVTLELSARMPHECIFAVASCCLLCINADSMWSTRRRTNRFLGGIWLSALAAPTILAMFADNYSPMRLWVEHDDRGAWARLLPADAYRGAFTTERARYLYGERAGQFIAMSGAGVCDTLPPDEHAAEVVALHLAQKPDAQRVLVFGENALGICADFKKLPRIADVTWMNVDPEYPRDLWRIATDQNRIASPMRLDLPEEDLRVWARATDKRYDLIVLNLPDVTTLAINRYCTPEFFALLKRILAENGVVSVRVSGGANFLGGELAYLGSAMLHTIESAFTHVVIKPGDETWFLASDEEGLSQAPATLRDRFASVEGGSGLYPPEGILALYPPDRAEFQLNAYRKVIAETDPQLLRNTDREPKALAYGLFLAIKQAEWRVLASVLPDMFRAGWWMFLTPVALYGFLRTWYVVRSFRGIRLHREAPSLSSFPRKRESSPHEQGLRMSWIPAFAGMTKGADMGGNSVFDTQFLVFSTGLASMAFSIVLMFLYQARFGSLVTSIGILLAVFMLGSTLGGLAGSRFFVRARRGIAVLLACHVGLLGFAAFLPDAAPRTLWFPLMGLAGFFTGVYFPIAAARMQRAGRAAASSGSILETVDHLGGAFGALTTGLLMLPIVGGAATLGILAILVAINLASIPFAAHGTETRDRFDRIARPLGYTALGVAAYLLIVSQVIVVRHAADTGAMLAKAARDLAGDAEVREEQARLAGGNIYPYFVVVNAQGQPDGYVFSTARWSSRIAGYGGPMTLAVYADRDGVLGDYRVLQSNETPAYMALVDARRQRLLGRRIFDPDPFSGVELVTGASITWDALSEIIETAGRGFAAEVLGKGTLEPASFARFDWADPRLRDFIYLCVLTVLAIALRYRPNVWARRVFLLIVLVVSGWLLNLQYSTQHVASLLSLNPGTLGLNAPFFLVVVIPIFVALFGNFYCGYLCPFGALQELVGDLNPRNAGVDKSAWRYGRGIKYALLFLFIALYAVTRDFGMLRADPLTTLFGAGRDRFVLLAAAACVGLSLCFPRFWCRTLCPAGAFLSLFNGISGLRRIMPARYPGQCDLGVRGVDDLDCICCDRCRQQRARIEPKTALRSVFVAAVMLLMLAVAVHTVSAARAYVNSIATEAATVSGAAGKPRALDLERVRQLIRERGLSSREADFYAPTK